MKVYLNGRYLDSTDACIAIDDRGFLFGDALYESIRIYKGGFFRFREHHERLEQGAKALEIEMPPPEELRAAAEGVAGLNGIGDGILRVTVTRGPGGEGLRTAGAGPPTVLVTARSIPRNRMVRAEVGFTAITARSRRSPVGLPVSIKSANRLDAIMARLEADAAGVDEAVLLSAQDFVAECTAANIFWRTGDRLSTPDLSIGVLPGVTRAAVLEAATRLGIEVEQGCWPIEALRAAPEAFLTMSSLGPVRLVKLDSKTMMPAEGDLLPAIRRGYWSMVEEEVARDPISLGRTPEA